MDLKGSFQKLEYLNHVVGYSIPINNRIELEELYEYQISNMKSDLEVNNQEHLCSGAGNQYGNQHLNVSNN